MDEHYDDIRYNVRSFNRSNFTLWHNDKIFIKFLFWNLINLLIIGMKFRSFYKISSLKKYPKYEKYLKKKNRR